MIVPVFVVLFVFICAMCSLHRQVYKKLGDQSKAMVHLTRALDLSPKDAQQIKVSRTRDWS